MSSLPLPVSPSIRTVALVLAAWRISRFSCRMAGLLPMKESGAGRFLEGWRYSNSSISSLSLAYRERYRRSQSWPS